MKIQVMADSRLGNEAVCKYTCDTNDLYLYVVVFVCYNTCMDFVHVWIWYVLCTVSMCTYIVCMYLCTCICPLFMYMCM